MGVLYFCIILNVVSIFMGTSTYRYSKRKRSTICGVASGIFELFFILIWIILTKKEGLISDGLKTSEKLFFVLISLVPLLLCGEGIAFAIVGGSGTIKSKKGSNGGSNEMETNYKDEIVLKYFENEKSSGCFGGTSKYTDKMYDNILLKWINENASKACALKRINIDESMVNEVEPICFQGYESESGFMGRYGLDGKFRTTQYSVTWLFFSDEQIFVFNVFFDLLYHKTKIITYEYFYKDITNFSSIFSSYEYEKLTEKKGCLKSGFDKELKKVETQKFSIVVPGDSFSCSVSGVAKIDGIIQGLKQKLREKKVQNG